MNQFLLEDYRLIVERSARPNDTGEVCWWKLTLLVAPPMPERSEGGVQMKCSPWSSKLGVGCGANDPTPGKFTVAKPWRRPKPTQGCSASTEEK